MSLRKIFRMQYEPCNGTCYAWDDEEDSDDTSSPFPEDDDAGGGGDILPMRALRHDPKKLKRIMDKLVGIHEKLCGNKNLRVGIDLDEKRGIFIGSFWHYGKLELFTDTCRFALIETMADFIIPFYKTEAYKEESKQDPGVGHSVCEHGEDDDLCRFIIRTARIPTPNGLDHYLNELKKVA